MSATPEGSTQEAKGLSGGQVGLLGAVVIGVSTIAPAYTLTGALGPTASAVGDHLPAIFIVGFVPMLLVALGYRALNNAMPDAGTTFTWSSRAFGPWIGWMGGWGLLAATILVLSNLAGIAVDFFYLMLAQLTGNDGIADLAGTSRSTSRRAWCSWPSRAGSPTADSRPPRRSSTCSSGSSSSSSAGSPWPRSPRSPTAAPPPV